MQHWKRNKKPEFGGSRIIPACWKKKKYLKPTNKKNRPKTPVKLKTIQNIPQTNKQTN